jgi:hypothetical protein
MGHSILPVRGGVPLMNDHAHLEIIAPFLSRSELVELCSGRHFEDYKKARIHRARVEASKAIRRQERLGRCQQGIEKRVVKANGVEIRHTAEIDPELYVAMQHQYGYDCWKDKGFFNDMLKKNPAMKVPDPPRKTWAVNGLKDANSPVPDRS